MVAPDLQELMALLPPPAEPVGSHGDWALVESDLGLRLPEDYKQFIDHYGAGTISGLIVVGNPLIQPVSARRFWENWVDIFRDIAHYGTAVPFSLFPTSPGLLPCAHYADFDIISWYTGDDANNAELLYYSRAEGFFNLGRITLTRFIVQLLTASTALPTNVVTNVLQHIPRRFVPGAVFA